MFDKHWFYYTANISQDKYRIDFGWSLDLSSENKEYVIFHKRKFKKIPLNKIQNSMQILTKENESKVEFDEKFFKHWLTYYQRQVSQAFLKGGWKDEMEVYQGLFNDFSLKLKLKEYLEIHWDYSDLDEILKDFQNINFNQAISFILWLSCVYWERNLVESNDDVFLWNIMLKFPFDWRLWEFQDIITILEDSFMKENIYNKISFTKKQEFMINIKDKDILKIFWKLIFSTKLRKFFQIDEILETFFDKQQKLLSKQLNQDLKIDLDRFKLTEISSISLDF